MSELVSLMQKLELQNSYIESMMNKINTICGDSDNFESAKFIINNKAGK